MIDLVAEIALGILGTSLVLAFARLVRGPALGDRALALDLISTISVAVAAVVAIRFRSTVYLDVAVVLGLIAFIGTVAFARYLERGERR
ncbi:MAG TPA: monovalent cation/H+ antiporter complex subunit F [Candidatus Krumholzibacteria bacterium]|nr:monovalent cation/H+ antiporter complex subunit F [Candidatus Krumholzibacteria bacterium]